MVIKIIAAAAISADALRHPCGGRCNCHAGVTTKGILIGSHIAQCHTIKDQPFAQEEELLEQQLRQMNTSDLAVLDETAAQAMRTQIEEAAMQGDSVGGILESAILHLPAGIGEPFFDSMESRLSHLLFSVPAVKVSNLVWVLPFVIVMEVKSMMPLFMMAK